MPAAPSRADGAGSWAARARAGAIALAILAITAVHLAVTVATHRQHVVHVVFRGLYLLPVVAGAVWFRLRGAVLAAVAVSVAYSAHVVISWRDQSMENANQYVMLGVFLFVGAAAGVLAEREERERERRLESERGAAAGVLAEREERERERRLESERRAERSAVVQGIAGLSNALGFRDEYTRAHCEHVAHLSVDTGTRLGLGAEERARVERHPALAAEILRPIHGAGPIAEIVLSHHECPDGSGYPRGLKGNEIPLEARILRAADVFSALTEARPYKEGMARERALEMMRQLAGTKLDPESLAALREAVGSGAHTS